MAIIYVPALKAKMGELIALNALTNEDKQVILPILEVPEIPWDYIEDHQSKKVEEHLSAVGKLIEKNWKDLPFFLDFLPKIEVTPTEDGKTAFEAFLSLPETKKLKFIPVI